MVVLSVRAYSRLLVLQKFLQVFTFHSYPWPIDIIYTLYIYASGARNSQSIVGHVNRCIRSILPVSTPQRSLSMDMDSFLRTPMHHISPIEVDILIHKYKPNLLPRELERLLLPH